MRFLFCNDDFESQDVDPCFAMEANAVSTLELKYDLIDFNALRSQNIEQAVRFVTKAQKIENAIYRGWMLTPEEYQLLYRGLKQQNVTLINSPDEYRHCHWLSESFSIIKEITPKSVFLPFTGAPDYSAVMDALKPFGNSPIIVKDYVKSQKHKWFDACYIPDATDESHVKRVTSHFIELQDVFLQGGLVFREFIKFESLGNHPKSGMPITLEFRLFVVDGSIVATIPYWEAEYSSKQPLTDHLVTILENVKSNFFSCDVAKTINDEWLIIELGDGQVSGIPESGNIKLFYEQLINSLDNKE